MRFGRAAWVSLVAAGASFSLSGAIARAVVPPLSPNNPSTLETVTPHLTSFYRPPAGATKGHAGDLVRVQRIDIGFGVRAWRVLYRSETLTGKTTVVSGIVLTPGGRAPRHGFPVIAFAHGTTGVNRSCGISQSPDEPATPSFSTFRRFWAYFLNAGFAVVATDYQGMGGPGSVAYLVGLVNSRNLLDAVRATGQLSAHAHGVPALDLQRIIVYGHSEGGQTSAFVAQIAHSYAPEIKIAGDVVSAPANPPNTVSEINFYRTLGPSELSGYAVMLDYAWGQMYASRGFHPAQTDTSAAIARFRDLETMCADAAADTFTLPLADYLRPPGPNFDTYLKLAAENQPAHTRSVAPVLLVQGLADVAVFPASTEQVLTRMCKLGDRVDYITFPGASHKGVVPLSMPDVISWARARIAGKPAPSTCT